MAQKATGALYQGVLNRPHLRPRCSVCSSCQGVTTLPCQHANCHHEEHCMYEAPLTTLLSWTSGLMLSWTMNQVALRRMKAAIRFQWMMFLRQRMLLQGGGPLETRLGRIVYRFTTKPRHLNRHLPMERPRGLWGPACL